MNAAQRLQGVGRRFDDGALRRGRAGQRQTAQQAGDAVPMRTVGLRGLAGRERPIEVFRLA